MNTTLRHFGPEFFGLFRILRMAVVGMFDALLSLCRDQSLELNCRADNWSVRCSGGAWEDVPRRLASQSRPFEPSLARAAAMCNERDPNSVFALRRGQGDLAFDGRSSPMVRVVFVNTPDEQRIAFLQLHPKRSRPNAAPDSDGGRATVRFVHPIRLKTPEL